MKKVITTLTAALLAVGAHADSLKFISVSYPGIYCHFSANCQVSPVEQSDSFTPTNVAVACVLESRSFAGNSIGSTGQYGYEYRLTLNNNNNNNNYVPGGAFNEVITNIVTIDSLTLNFGEPEYFAFGDHASNQVWVVDGSGITSPGLPPGSADFSGNQVVFHFDPPLTLATQTDQTTNTCYFGLISGSEPQITTAILSGSAQDPVNGPVPFKAKLQAQTP